MERFETLHAIACPLGLTNIDTDQLIPARFMSRSRGDGYGDYLLHDLRFDACGALRSSFALNQPGYARTKIIVARRNFGMGSSREAAVYALSDYGIRCVIAPSFGDIFAANAVKNGLLPAVLGAADLEKLLQHMTIAPMKLHVDLPAQSIRADNLRLAFEIDPVRKLQLLNGWDDVDLTARHTQEIAAYRQRRFDAEPWTMPPTKGPQNPEPMD